MLDATTTCAPPDGRRADLGDVRGRTTENDLRARGTDQLRAGRADELTVLDVCIDCDDEGLYELIQDGVAAEQVNEQDKSGRVTTTVFLF